MRLTLGVSPCPNDTYIFHELLHPADPDAAPFQWDVVMEDVETLNGMAMDGALDVCKVSAHAAALLGDEYVVLRAGGALGYGCGPLVVTTPGRLPASGNGDVSSRSAQQLWEQRIAIPGTMTTAALLLDLFGADLGLPPARAEHRPVLRYDAIMDAVAQGQADAGVIIHESRFTYQERGLVAALDLGAWWETALGLPIPLGLIVMRRDLHAPAHWAVEQAIRRSLQAAIADPERSAAFIAAHAQEMAAEICALHIQTFVNEFSMALGPRGETAVEAMVDRVRERRGLNAVCSVFPEDDEDDD